MSFKSQLAALRGKVARELPTGLFDRLQVEAADLRVSGRWRTALKAGQAAPDLQLPAGTGGVIRLNHLLEGGPVVVCFYRGDWCRFCRLQLQALADIADDVSALGASLIAIAPRTAVAQAACAVTPPFPLLADVEAKVCKSFGLTFLPPDDLGDAYRALGRPVGDEHLALPVPAIYVIDRSSMIVFSYLDTDFTSRLDPREILAVLRRLRVTQEAANLQRFHPKIIRHSGPAEGGQSSPAILTRMGSAARRQTVTERARLLAFHIGITLSRIHLLQAAPAILYLETMTSTPSQPAL